MTTKTKCTKQGYSSMEAARRVAAERSAASGDDIQAYLCPKCRWPHLKNSTKRRIKLQERFHRRRKKR